jgi:translation initiation factor IF-3
MSRRSVRVNAEITAAVVSIIGPDGEKLETMPTTEALHLARRQGLDLVEVDPSADPPVCKIFNFQKFKYETAKARVRAGHERVELEIRDNQIKERD